jgi:hypothetical protein
VENNKKFGKTQFFSSFFFGCETKRLLLDQGLFLDNEVYRTHWCIIAKYKNLAVVMHMTQLQDRVFSFSETNVDQAKYKIMMSNALVLPPSNPIGVEERSLHLSQ